LLKATPFCPSLVVIGQVTIQGHAILDNGAKPVLLPTESERQFVDVSGDTVEKVDPTLYYYKIL
jgi:hypothetical protein